MAADDAVVSVLVEAIAFYLEAHPHAADSPEGIQAWWLPTPLNHGPLAAVVAALEELERRGIVEKAVLDENCAIYRALPRDVTRH